MPCFQTSLCITVIHWMILPHVLLYFRKDNSKSYIYSLSLLFSSVFILISDYTSYFFINRHFLSLNSINTKKSFCTATVELVWNMKLQKKKKNHQLVTNRTEQGNIFPKIFFFSSNAANAFINNCTWADRILKGSFYIRAGRRTLKNCMFFACRFMPSA